uniref:Fe2OG dioxygenase domain-containing protein n=1 Tax=Chlamydomonas euryale TaxID=1486919 RepID=A0A7R9Z064_9CHLO|mmetsp:Transcript_36736/g.108327  ORF Transcript_36736/g.108327 Transcript_36736/m.108327 type:complete len:361 (+) Transcript_36736:164-1246(+)
MPPRAVEGAWVAAVAALLLMLAAAVAAEERPEELLIGWRGETFRGIADASSSDKPHAARPWIETISWSPRAFVYHNFLSSAECDYLVKKSKDRLKPSTVVDSKTGLPKLDPVRTSSGSSFARGANRVVAGVEQRIAEWTHLPPEHGEPLQVLHYVDGQQYIAHRDWFHDPVHMAAQLKNGNRYASVVMYLSDVEEGGETSLPLAVPIDAAVQRAGRPSACVQRGGGLAVTPRKGDALLFFDMDVAGKAGDLAALHGSCPTLRGAKWTATKWIHSKVYQDLYNPAAAGAVDCVDMTLGCSLRRLLGACRQDSIAGRGGKCRRTCGDCRDCAKGDKTCQRANLHGLLSAEQPTNQSERKTAR